MPLPSSGSISLNQVNVELGRSATATISMNESAVRTLFGVGASGQIAMNQGLGKANQFNLTIASDTANLDVRAAALAGGWGGSSKVIVTINSGVFVYSNSTGSYAMTISGSFPGGIEVVNNGTIVGGGGGGARASDLNTPGLRTNGGNAGPALYVTTAVTFTNSGRIAGGGGGGGSGGYNGVPGDGTGTGGGGGGGIGNGPAAGFFGTGTSGTLTAPGSGANGATYFSYTAGRGGDGGGYGSSGASGQGGYSYSPGSGGAAGAAVVGNSNITWVATGTRNGSIS